MEVTMQQPNVIGDLEIRPIRGTDEPAECARLMSGTEPWLTLGRTYDQALRLLTSETREVYVARASGVLVGFIVLWMQGPFVGFVQTLAVKPQWRGRGIGKSIMQFAERRIFNEFRNVFLCVSSFNESAMRFYLRLGYHRVGDLTEMLIPGHSEILMRKTTGPLAGG
jgi:ribosomal protein S18 acetylase RimI-like enzyme